MNQYFVKCAKDYEWEKELEILVKQFNRDKGRVYGTIGIVRIPVPRDVLLISDKYTNIVEWVGEFNISEVQKDFDSFIAPATPDIQENDIIRRINEHFSSTGRRIKLLLYFMTTCRYCGVMIELVHKLAFRTPGLFVRTINVRSRPKQDVEAVPTVFYENEKFVGAADSEVFYDWLDRVAL